MAFSLAAKLRQKPAVNVDIKAIDLTDRAFAVSTPQNMEALANSLRFAGLLHTVWLRPKGSHYQIISGFLRVQSCLELGWETIPAQVLAEDITNLEMARLAIMDNLAARPLNVLEEARAIALLRKHTASEEAFSRNLNELGLSQNPKHWAKLNKLLQLPAITQQAVAGDLIALSVGEELAEFNEEIILHFTDIFVKGKVGLNRQREFIRLVFELGCIKDLPPEAVFELPEFGAVWHNNAETDQRKKALLLLEWLYQTRYPHLTAARNAARKKIAGLGLDGRIRLNMPENFENLRHSLSFSFESKAELLELLDLCLKMAADDNLNKLFQRDEV